MSRAIEKQFGLMVPHGRLHECIAFLEEGMKCLRPTPYHAVLGKHFLPQTDSLAECLVDCHRQWCGNGASLAAIYLEMNGFAINPDCWFCDIFGYKEAGTIWDLEWLAHWNFEVDQSFELQGFEEAQAVFANLFLQHNPLGVELAEEIAEHLVTARFMELVAAAHKKAQQGYAPLAGLRVLATAHDWDRVHQTT